MRDYQRQKNNKYILPHAEYHRTLWLIRDYPRLKAEIENEAGLSSVEQDGMPRGGQIPDPTAVKAMNIEKAMDIVNLIDRELNALPVEYRKGVWDSIVNHKPYPNDADRSTYGRAKSRFVYNVAKGYENL